MRTTVVGKLTLQLNDDGSATLVTPDTFIAFDRLASDRRFVAEASELMPWTTVASVLAYDGPLRFALEPGGNLPNLYVSLSAQEPAGNSMSSAERSIFARSLPTRGADGLMTIPDGIDGRYFVAAHKKNQLVSLRGDEWFTLEAAGWSTRRRLPGMAIKATVTVEDKPRTIALTTDMITVHGAARRISLISRAVIGGEAELVREVAVPLAELDAQDRGVDTRELRLYPGSSDGGAQPDARSPSSTPFQRREAEPPRASERNRASSVPATPFDPGFLPKKVVPAGSLVSTLNSDESLEAQMLKLRKDLKSDGTGGAHAEPPKPSGPAAEPPANPPAGARVAPPKPGGMAKPRFKPR